MDRWTIGSLLETAAGYLREKGSPSPRLDAELLLAETLGLERIHLYTQYDRPLSRWEVDHYRGLIGRRARHEPVAYIMGHAYFRHLRLEVTPAVLIPRPETEELVDIALQTIRLKPPWGAVVAPGAAGASGAQGAGASTSTTGTTTAPRAQVPPQAPVIADVGTGSGAIALSVAQEAGLRVLGLDSSPDALAVVARNRAALGLERQVELRQSDLLAGVADRSLCLVVSNPPYVSAGDLSHLTPDIRLYEPASALDGGPDGLAVFRRLLPEAAGALKPGGGIVVEVGAGQAPAVARLAADAGFCLVESHKDLSQKERVVTASLPGAPVFGLGELSAAEAAALGAALEAGALVGIPTDTVYGLAARWDSALGVRRLLAAKGRGAEQPLAVIFSSVSDVEAALPDLDPVCETVLAAMLPGPFTFVVSTSVPRPGAVGTGDSLGVRVPAFPAVLELLATLGVAVAATSANLSGGEDPATLAQVDPVLLAHCALAFAPPTLGAKSPRTGDEKVDRVRGVSSTVVDLRPVARGEAPIILREGAVGAAETSSRIASLF